MAWPSVLTNSLMTINQILDRYFVGGLGKKTLAAAGIGGQVLFLMVCISIAITVGTTALVARFTGGGDEKQANRATGQSIALGLSLGIIGAVFLYFSASFILKIMADDAEVRNISLSYLHIAIPGIIPMFVGAVMSSALRGIGDTRTPLRVMVAANCIHITGDWTFMLGHWGAPKLGLPGGAMALSASNLISTLLFIHFIRRSPLAGSLAGHQLKLTLMWSRRVLRIGIPAALAATIRSTSMMGYTGILSKTHDGTNALAALPIGMTAESIAFMPGLGFSLAASALVGQALGAKQPDRATRYGWISVMQGALLMSVMGLVFFLGAEVFARQFTSDPAVIKLAVAYLRIMAISEPFLAFGMILTGALQGAGDTIRPTILTFFSFWGVRIPLTWFLALKLHMEANGAWYAMCATTVVGGILTIQLFADGRWKRVRV